MLVILKNGIVFLQVTACIQNANFILSDVELTRILRH